MNKEEVREEVREEVDFFRSIEDVKEGVLKGKVLLFIEEDEEIIFVDMHGGIYLYNEELWRRSNDFYEISLCYEEYFNKYLNLCLDKLSEEDKNLVKDYYKFIGEIVRLDSGKYVIKKFNIGDVVRYSDSQFLEGKIKREKFTIVDIDMNNEKPYKLRGNNKSSNSEFYTGGDYIGIYHR